LRLPSQRPPDDPGVIAEQPEAFRIKASPRLSHRVPNGDPASEQAPDGAGRTPHHFSTRPLLLQEDNPLTDAALSLRDLARLRASLTQRDLAILTCLAAYRYLNLRQLELLFFPGSRSAQIRLKQLKDHGLLQRWQVVEPPGITRRPSVFLLSPHGARVLAASRSEDPKPLVRQARMAELHCLNLTHDLEANGFFVGLAAASRDLPDQGLGHWVGEAAMRVAFRNGKRRSRQGEAAPASDGWGRYLIPSGELIFDLEWDRGTESLQRLEQKIRSYIGYFKNRRDAELHHVLFVLPHAAREEAVLKRIQQELPTFALSCCRYWLTNRPLMEQAGPLAEIWLYARPPKEPMDDRGLRWRAPAPGRRLGLAELPARRRQPRDLLACIGKPGWWHRRPGGPEGA
jgi:hypothetical protein